MIFKEIQRYIQEALLILNLPTEFSMTLLDILRRNKTSVAVAVMAAYISYTTLAQYWAHLRGAIQ